LYAVLLGNTELTHMTAIAPAALEYADVRLRVWFNDGTKGFQLISPDQRLAASPYALAAENAALATSFSGSLVGDVTGTQSATAISAATVTGKLLTGYVSGAGTLSATDTILTAINKLNGNDALKANLASPTFSGTTSGTFSGPLTGNVTGNVTGSAASFTGSLVGDVTGTQSATAISAATVTGKALTGYVSGAGTLSATDSILTAINKLNGNDALKATLASPTFTGTVRLPAGTATAAPMIFTSGTNLSPPVAGALEFDGSQLYVTTTGLGGRKALAFADAPNGAIAVAQLVAAPSSPVIAWGDNSEGQTRVPSLENVIAVAAGAEHSLALTSAGTVVAWGDNTSGQTTVPTGALTGVTQIAAGFNHNVVRKSDGTLLAWGASGYGRTTIPGGITTATKVAAGSLHSLALLQNGTVVAWGDTTFGQSYVPGSLTGVTAIAAGESHSLALSAGTVVAWGSNAAGQTTVPTAALSGITAIAAGWNHSLALKSDGTVLAWGLSTGGQTTVPVGLSGVIGIAAGDAYSLALKSDGTLIAWGFEAPVTSVPGGATEVASIAAGGAHALALRAETVPVELASLDYAGRLGVGRDPAINTLEVEGNASKTTASNWLANSDRRIKTEIETVTGALETLSQVRLVNFRYTPDYLAAHPGLEDRSYLNVIAQEFAEVFPDHVQSSGETMPDGSPILQVDTYPLTIFTAAAVQELQRENAALKAQLASQEERLLKLEAALQGK
jgi:alpha-tubulin suppressor-like RCC1 family protein